MGDVLQLNMLMAVMVIASLTGQTICAPENLSPASQSSRSNLIHAMGVEHQDQVAPLVQNYEDNPLDAMDSDQLKRLSASLLLRLSEIRSVLSDVLRQSERDGVDEDGSSIGRNFGIKRSSSGGQNRGSGRIRNGYNFGLGKRGNWFFPRFTGAPFPADIKRRYNFGLGKRSADDLLPNGNAGSY